MKIRTVDEMREMAVTCLEQAWLGLSRERYQRSALLAYFSVPHITGNRDDNICAIWTCLVIHLANAREETRSGFAGAIVKLYI